MVEDILDGLVLVGALNELLDFGLRDFLFFHQSAEQVEEEVNGKVESEVVVVVLQVARDELVAFLQVLLFFWCFGLVLVLGGAFFRSEGGFSLGLFLSLQDGFGGGS